MMAQDAQTMPTLLLLKKIRYQRLTRGVDGEATKVYEVFMTGDNESIIIAQQGDDVRPLVYSFLMSNQ